MLTWACERCAATNPAAATACAACLNPAPATRPAPLRANDTPPPPKRVVTALAVTAAVLLIAGLLGVVFVSSTDDEGDTTAPDGRPAAEAFPELQPEVQRLQRFVERHRGLTFKEPVDVRIVNDEEMKQELRRETRDDAEEIDDFNRIARALGYIEPGQNVRKEFERLYDAGVVGLYDPEAKKLFVRGTELSPLVEVTLVHELTHALQDQHFGLHRPDLDEVDDESGAGFQAIVEGDAERIALIYREQLPAEQQKEIEREEIAATARYPQDAPPALLAGLVFPYAFGPRLVEQIVERGGQSALDAAFADPPRWTEQILHPDLFLAGDHPVPDVPHPQPAGDAEAIDEGRIGEFDLGLILGIAGVDNPQIAAQGWGADRYVAWRNGDEGGCVRFNLRMDTAKDAAEVRQALQELATKRKGVTVTTGRQVIGATLCG